MKNFLKKNYLLLLPLLIIVLFYNTIEKKVNTEEMNTFYMSRSGNTYRIGEGNLYQIEPKTIDSKERIIYEWDIPFINEMDPYDVFLIIEQQRNRQYSYPYKEIISSKRVGLFKKKISFIEKEGRLEWDTLVEGPIILTKSVSEIKEESHITIWKIALIVLASLVILLLLLSSIFSFRLLTLFFQNLTLFFQNLNY